MREIVFRGKKIDNGEWIKGTVLNGLTKTYIVYDKAIYHTMLAKSVLTADRYFEIYPETIGQYTGLKDKNGKMIWEGDIVEFETNLQIYDTEFQKAEIKPIWKGVEKKIGYMADYYVRRDQAIVQWNSKLGMWDLKVYNNNKYKRKSKLFTYRDYQVIGNIHDNPELLKEQL